MSIVRTIVWVLLLVALLLFSFANWDPTVTVRIWEGIVVDTKIPAIVIVSFLIGFVPMWLYHRAAMWRMRRKVASLENAARTAAATPVATSHSDATTTTGTTAGRAPVTSDETETAVTRSDVDGDGDTDTVHRETRHRDDDVPGTYRSPGS
ncbi:LapA family protein [Aurantiacibacter spongiae]|uniref:LapA family protein n=1 Tax=Aurantiacibacter spongiae TaxID=2488860 RepID=A0A3N5D7S5_9SPHN|nr:LapA family protein [Aurantiacibacter spongiae]RPF70628.1 LapA family protein [Aurantiacibacter spongiae]